MDNDEKETMLSVRGKDLMVIEDYKYRKVSTLKDGVTRWRCTVKSCRANLYTTGEEKAILRGQYEHNHFSDRRKLELQKIASCAKKKAEQDLLSTPTFILRSVLHENNTESISYKDINNVKKRVYDVRKKVIPMLPNAPDNMQDSDTPVFQYVVEEEPEMETNEDEGNYSICSTIDIATDPRLFGELIVSELELFQSQELRKLCENQILREIIEFRRKDIEQSS